MSIQFYRCIGFLSALFVAAPAAAVTITEGVDYVDGANPNVGTVDVGITTISGTISGDCTGAIAPFACTTGADPRDTFTFDLAVGAEIVGIEVDLVSGVSGPAGFTLELGVDDGGGAAVFSNLLPGVYALVPLDPLVSAITLEIAGYDADAGGPFSVDWTATVEAIAVNVPTPLPLSLLACAAGLTMFRRRANRVEPETRVD